MPSARTAASRSVSLAGSGNFIASGFASLAFMALGLELRDDLRADQASSTNDYDLHDSSFVVAWTRAGINPRTGTVHQSRLPKLAPQEGQHISADLVLARAPRATACRRWGTREAGQMAGRRTCRRDRSVYSTVVCRWCERRRLHTRRRRRDGLVLRRGPAAPRRACRSILAPCPSPKARRF